MLASETLARLQAYRGAVASRYQPIAPGDITSKIHGSCWVSPKVDGELWFLVQEEGAWILAAPNGRELTDAAMPILAAAASSALPSDMIIAGELHVPGTGEDRERVGGVSSAIRSSSLDRLAFAAFDVASAPDVDPVATPYSERMDLLEALPDQGALFRVTVEKAEGGTAVEELFRNWVQDQRREGIVVRVADGRAYKVKPSFDLDGAIVGFTERRADDGTLEIRSLLVAIAHPNGGWVPLATTGNVGDAATRRSLYEELAPTVCPSDFRRTSDNSGISYRFVEPRLVAELRVTDAQAEDAKGHLIRDPRLAYDPKIGWKVDGWVPSAGLLYPAFQRLRTDKQAAAEDCGWNQIERLLPLPAEDGGATISESRVLRRQVWTKQGKDKVDVRKLLVWETGKESLGFAPYVVHWTDFSAGRKAPLTREVRLAPNEAEAMRIADQMVADNVKKGWEEVA
jgi:hypothetical protein